MKTALVTGASRGIGEAIARALSKDGFKVFINYLNSREKALALAEEISGTAVRADVSDLAQVRSMFDEIGGVNVLVCNAGISDYGLFSDISSEKWRGLFAVNVDGVYNCAQCALPSMISRKEGSIITVSSVWGLHGASCEAAYSASKSALVGLTKALAKELGPSGIRVNCIAPGVIETDMMAGFSEEDKNRLAEQTPLCRLGKPSEVAELAAFLASEKAAFITGQIIGADGGFAI
ncbi:MAG: SDR family oxidoreductase [Oscillospiraceae bacterium]|nr:SDR family oxidoreductase [Oscillospiraceae bacterium]